MERHIVTAGAGKYKVDFQRTNRREFLGLAVGSALAGIAPALLRGEGNPFRLNYIVASSMYGRLPLGDVLAEVGKTGDGAIDIWPERHANHREQIEAMGHQEFAAMLKRHKVKVGILTHFDLGPFDLQAEMKAAKRFGGSMIICGSNMAHGWDRDDQNRERNKRLLRRVGAAPDKEADGIARLVIRRDGFISVRAGYSGGEFVTPIVTFDGDELVLNIDTSAVGQARVEILDEQSKPVSRYSLADCDEIYTANEINRVVRWNGSSAVSELAGRPIHLRFVMRDADLYAFQFRKSTSK